MEIFLEVRHLLLHLKDGGVVDLLGPGEYLAESAVGLALSPGVELGVGKAQRGIRAGVVGGKGFGAKGTTLGEDFWRGRAHAPNHRGRVRSRRGAIGVDGFGVIQPRPSVKRRRGGWRFGPRSRLRGGRRSLCGDRRMASGLCRRGGRRGALGERGGRGEEKQDGAGGRTETMQRRKRHSEPPSGCSQSTRDFSE